MQYSIPKVIWLALIGFLFTIVVLLWPFWKENVSPYGELRFSFRKNIDSLLNERAKRLEAAIVRITDTIDKIEDASVKKKFADKLEALRLVQSATYIERQRCDTLNTDTLSVRQRNYFHIGIDTLHSLLLNKQKSSPFILPVVIRDSVNLVDSNVYEGKTAFVKGYYNPHKSAFAFYSQQPGFALWFFLSLAQAVIWFMAIGAMVSMITFGSLKPKGIKDFFRQPFVIAATVTGLFCLALYWYIIDTRSLPDHLFMNAFNSRILIYAIPGYLAAAICFAAYLHALAPLQTAANSNIVNKRNTSPNFEAAQRQINMALAITATVLCFFVLWLSSLFNSINTLPALKTYAAVTGHQFLPNDFVYLMGLAHSLLLAIFYIPVQVKTNGLRKEATAVAYAAAIATATATTPPPTQPWWKKILPNLLELMVPMTPLLTAILKGLIDALK